MISLTSISLALSWAGSIHSWGSAAVLVPLIVGIAGFAAFVVYELKVPRIPTLPFQIFVCGLEMRRLTG